MVDSFYVTLPSNSSMDTHPKNTLSHFFVTLPTPLVFEGDWEVGLVEFTYPHRWYNILDTSNQYACSAEEQVPGFHFHSIPPGYYPTPEELLDNINPHPDHNGLVSIKYNKYNQKIVVKTKGDVTVNLYDRIAELFGFDEDDSVIWGTEKGSRVVDINLVNSMFLYIIDHHIVGNTRAPLLRIVNVEGNPGETITKLYDSPHYIPLKQKLVDTIEMDIRDDTGRAIPFVSGKVIVKLHFRKRHSAYFN